MDEMATRSCTGSMKLDDYDGFREYLERNCGIALAEDKRYLVESRLSGLLREYAIASLGELLERLRYDRHPQLRARVIDAMTTNETQWFRDGYPFDLLKQVLLPRLAAMRLGRAVRIWSAACSSGQEPYSISMTVQEYLLSNPGGLPHDVQIIATDISPTMLEQARAGVYDESALARGLSAQRRQWFFLRQGKQAVVRPEIRRRVTFQELNLQQPYTALGKFDVVFCRNVLIYFSAVLKRDVLTRLAGAMYPGGYLILGATESACDDTEAFEIVRHSPGVLYRLRARTGARRS
jgi:chemotaxis protein methyltransferase CheR